MNDDTDLRDTARALLHLYNRHPTLFRHVLPIDDETVKTLLEIAELAEYDDDEEPPDAAE